MRCFDSFDYGIIHTFLPQLLSTLCLRRQGWKSAGVLRLQLFSVKIRWLRKGGLVFIYSIIFVLYFSPFYIMAQQPLVGQGLFIIEDSWSHSDTQNLVGLLWTSDQPNTEASTWQHTTLTTDKLPCLRRDSNPQSQQARGRRSTA